MLLLNEKYKFTCSLKTLNALHARDTPFHVVCTRRYYKPQKSMHQTFTVIIISRQVIVYCIRLFKNIA